MDELHTNRRSPKFFFCKIFESNITYTSTIGNNINYNSKFFIRQITVSPSRILHWKINRKLDCILQFYFCIFITILSCTQVLNTCTLCQPEIVPTNFPTLKWIVLPSLVVLLFKIVYLYGFYNIEIQFTINGRLAE